MHIQTDTGADVAGTMQQKKAETDNFSAVYLRYAKPMLNSSMRILNNLADAEDMVQEAFADAFTKIETYSVTQPMEAWLKRIVINKSIDLLRKRKQVWVDITTVPMADATDDDTIDEDAFRYEVEQVKKAIKNLPDNYRLVFNLFAVDNIPQEEIASLLGLSHNNVRTQYHRAKKKIVEFLKTELEYENR